MCLRFRSRVEPFEGISSSGPGPIPLLAGDCGLGIRVSLRSVLFTSSGLDPSIPASRLELRDELADVDVRGATDAR